MSLHWYYINDESNPLMWIILGIQGQNNPNYDKVDTIQMTISKLTVWQLTANQNKSIQDLGIIVEKNVMVTENDQ